MISISSIGSTVRRALKPTKLVEHIPGQKRVYLNRLTGTKTEYTLGNSYNFVKDLKTSGEDIKGLCIVDNNLHQLSALKNIYTHKDPALIEAKNIYSYTGDVPLDTPVTVTPFTRAKSYLFGLIKGKPTEVSTVNVADKIKIRADVASDWNVPGKTTLGMSGGKPWTAYVELPEQMRANRPQIIRPKFKDALAEKLSVKEDVNKELGIGSQMWNDFVSSILRVKPEYMM